MYLLQRRESLHIGSLHLARCKALIVCVQLGLAFRTLVDGQASRAFANVSKWRTGIGFVHGSTKRNMNCSQRPCHDQDHDHDQDQDHDQGRDSPHATIAGSTKAQTEPRDRDEVRVWVPGARVRRMDRAGMQQAPHTQACDSCSSSCSCSSRIIRAPAL